MTCPLPAETFGSAFTTTAIESKLEQLFSVVPVTKYLVVVVGNALGAAEVGLSRLDAGLQV